MRITKIIADEHGDSHFEDAEAQSLGEIISTGQVKVEASSMIFRETDHSHRQGWHCAPQKQYVVLLDGTVEVEVSDGELRQFKAGDIILVEDTHGSGHRTEVLSFGKRRSLFIPIPE